jgi:hypothetical protein
MKPFWLWRVLRRIAIGVLSLVVLFMATVAVYRWRGPTQAQRDALASMQERSRPPSGVNAFPLLWYLQYDVPDGERDARIATEVANARSRAAKGATPFFPEPDASKLAEATGNTSLLCDGTAPDCLEKVAADPRSVRDALATFPTLRARESAFENTDFYWSEFPVEYPVLSPAANPGAAQRIWLSAFALQYVDGDRSGALANVCRNVGTWRRLRHGTNSLIASMMAMREADGGLRLFAEMLAALPPAEPVPGGCSQALRPVEAADADRCAELAGEFAFGSSSMRDAMARRETEPWWNRASDWLFFDADQTDAWRAEGFSAYCGEGATRRMLADIPLSAETMPMRIHSFECVASLAGCLLDDIATPLAIQYDNRTLDFLAHLRLAATLLSMRESGSDESTAVRFENETDSKRSRQRHSGFDREAGVLFVDNLDTKRGARFELPVPRRGR